MKAAADEALKTPGEVNIIESDEDDDVQFVKTYQPVVTSQQTEEKQSQTK